MKILKKLFDLVTVAVLALAAGGYVFMQDVLASTNGILDTRSITMSSSATGNITAGTNVKYSVKFNIGTGGNVGGIVIDFCTEDPIPNDTCTAPSATFNTNKATLTINNPVGINAGFTIDSLSTAQTLEITNSTPVNLSQGTTVSFDLGNGTSNGFTNPNFTTCGSPDTHPNCSWYARIFTYTTKANAEAYNTTTHNDGSPVDAGGVALSTNAQLTIQSKVQEQLSLCIYTSTCSGGVSNPVLLGDSNDVLSTAHSFTTIVPKFQASTNAANGMNIYSSGATLTNANGNTITPIGATSALSSVGNEQFGFCIAVSGGSVIAASPYNDSNCSAVTTGQDASGGAKFAFDVTSTPNMTSLGGMKVAGSSGPSSTTTGTIAYLANIAVTTKAGVYTETQTFIAIGSF